MRGVLLALAIAVVTGACASAEKEPPPPPPAAGAILKDREGKEVGRVTLVETTGGVRVAVTGHRMPPGPKGLILSAVGICQPPAFTSAGTRRNPGGNLPDLPVGAAGEGSIDVVNGQITLHPGHGSLFTDNGTALIVLASPDAVRLDPLGTGGTRVACGVITRD